MTTKDNSRQSCEPSTIQPSGQSAVPRQSILHYETGGGLTDLNLALLTEQAPEAGKTLLEVRNSSSRHNKL